MQTPVPMKYPKSGSLVLGYSRTEEMWIPLSWNSEHQFWMCYFKGGNAQIFEQKDVIEWMEMPAKPFAISG
jgi:hypothetical protein